MIENHGGNAIPLLCRAENATRPTRHGRLARVLQHEWHQLLQRGFTCGLEKFPAKTVDLFGRVVLGVDALETEPCNIIGAASVGKQMAPAAGLLNGIARRFLTRDIRTGSRDDHNARPIAKSSRKNGTRILHHANHASLRPDTTEDFLHASFLGGKLASGESAADGLNAGASLFANRAK